MHACLEERIGVIALDGVDVHRCVAVQTLGVLRCANSLEVLCKALLDEDEDVRIDAATALGNLNDVRASDALLENLIGDPCGEVKTAALRSLIALRAKVVVPWLKKLILSRTDEIEWDDDFSDGWDEWLDLQIIALEGLGVFKTIEAIPLIEQALADEDGQDLTGQAVKTFSQMGEPAFPALCKMLETDNERRRRAVAKALGEYDFDLADNVLTPLVCDEVAVVRLEAAKSIFKYAPEDNRLLPLFWDPDRELRAFAVSFLGNYHPEWLEKCLSDDCVQVIEATLEKLCLYPQPGLKEKLLEFVENSDFQFKAIRALLAVDQVKALDILEVKVAEGKSDAFHLVLEVAQNETHWPNRAADILMTKISDVQMQEEPEKTLDVSVSETEAVSTLDEILAVSTKIPCQESSSREKIEETALVIYLLGFLPHQDVVYRLMEAVKGENQILDEARIRSILKLLQTVLIDDGKVTEFFDALLNIENAKVRELVIDGISRINAPWCDRLLQAEIDKGTTDQLDLILALSDRAAFADMLIEVFEEISFSQQQKIIETVANSKHPLRIGTLLQFACYREGMHSSFVARNVQTEDKTAFEVELSRLLESNAHKPIWSIAMQMTAEIRN